MKEEQNKRTNKVIQTLLGVSALEGLAALYILIKIPSDPKNAWMLNFSLGRWILIVVMVVGIALLATLLITSYRKTKFFNYLIRSVNFIIGNPNYWSVATMVSVGGSLVGVTILIFTLTAEFNLSSIRLAPILAWGTIISGQITILISFLYVRNNQVIFKLNEDGVKFRRTAIKLFLLSMVLRLIFAIPVIANFTPVQFDEIGYFEMATGIDRIVSNLISGELPSPALIEGTYNDGKWPPLHPAIMAINMLIFGSNLAVARLSVVFISALTTPLVYVLARKISNDKTGKFAALVHIFYPSFIAYAHYLWSESTYIFFLLAAVYFVVLLVEEEKVTKKYPYALMTGILLGLSGLVRTATLPYLIVIPIWILFSMRRVEKRAVYAAIAFSMCLLVWLPWLGFLQQKESVFSPLATTGGYNLLLGNNSIGAERDKPALLTAIDLYAKSQGVSRDAAARSLALEEIQSDIPRFISKSANRFVKIWVVDSFLMRHILNTVYAPISPSLVLWIWSAVVLGYISFMALALWGMVTSWREIRIFPLIMLLVISGMALPAISISTTRMHIPLMALLIPAVGMGISEMSRINTQIRKLKFSGVVLIVVVMEIILLPGTTGFLSPSNYYLRQMGKFDKLFGVNTILRDDLILKSGEDLDSPVIVSILTSGFYFESTGTSEIIWEPQGTNKEFKFVIVSEGATENLRLKIQIDGIGDSALIEPLRENAWKQWEDIGVKGIELYWVGGN